MVVCSTVCQSPYFHMQAWLLCVWGGGGGGETDTFKMSLFIQQVVDSFLLHCILQCILQWNLRLKDTFRIKDKI